MAKELRRPDAFGPAPQDAEVGDARDRFLSGTGEHDLQIRRLILASWERSREHKVDADRILAPFVRDPDLDEPLARSAAPVLDALHEQMRGEAVSTILTDNTGLVLDRRSSTLQISQSLDAVQLAPGFSYAEQFVGTNGIGTAITSGAAAFVDGREHYSGELGQFACAGAPIRHPVRGRAVGVLDITTWSQAPGAILMALASATAREIEAELLAQTGLRELELMREYMKVCARSSGPVLALNNDVVMMNDSLRHAVDPEEQQTLVGYAVDTMRGANRHAIRTVQLPSGRTARLRYTPASSETGLAGGVFRIRLERPSTPSVGGVSLQARTPGLPGLAGRGPAWTRCVQQTLACLASGDWFAVEGEKGAGKLALLRAGHQQRESDRRLRVIQPPDCTNFETWLGGLADNLAIPGATVVLKNSDQLTEQQASAVADLLTHQSWDSAAGPARVVMTLTAAGAPDALRSVFPRTVEVPALRHHIDDLPELIDHLLGQLTKNDKLTCSAQAAAHLARLDWPGNVTQLRQVLAATTKRRPAGVIDVTDLPPETRSASHRLLSPMEALERDAIVNALVANDENPTKAAHSIGMSRATIYRKIRQYGISMTHRA